MESGVKSDNKYETMVKGIRLIEKIMTDKFGAKQQGITAKWKFLNELIQKSEGIDGEWLKVISEYKSAWFAYAYPPYIRLSFFF